MIAFNGRAALALAAAAAAGLVIGGFAAAEGPVSTGRAEQAEALKHAAGVSGSGDVFEAGALRAEAAERAAGVPLPDGGTFNGVRWELGGDAAESDIQGVLQYNAACQWLRAWRDGREAALALEILADVPEWPAMRGAESGEFLAQVAEQAADGGGETASAMLADCDAAHAREVAYAESLNLPPST